MGQGELKKRIMPVKCLPCGGDFVDAELVSGLDIYPHRKDLKKLNFYRCPKCGGYVGCHPHTINPLGVIPTPEIRRARHKVHELIDPLWKDKRVSRKYIYKRLSEAVGHNFHNGESTSLEELRVAYREGLEIVKELLEKERREKNGVA